MQKDRPTQRRVDSFKPDEKILDVREFRHPGFGVRILPSGRTCFFLHRRSTARGSGARMACQSQTICSTIAGVANCISRSGETPGQPEAKPLIRRLTGHRVLL